MFWYLRKPEDDPHRVLQKLSEMNLEKLPKPEQLEIAKQVEGWRLAAGRNLYICGPSQKLYKWFLMPLRTKAIRGGNRSGKSAAIAIDKIMQAEGWHPLQKENLKRLAEEALEEWVRELARKILKGRRWIKSPPVRIRVNTIDFDTYVDTIIGPEYENWLTWNEVDAVNYKQEKRREIVWKNGSRLNFKTYKQELESHGGAAVGAVDFDEETTTPCLICASSATGSGRAKSILSLRRIPSQRPTTNAKPMRSRT